MSLKSTVKGRLFIKREIKTWDKSCEVCAVKRGWIKEVLADPSGFRCIHRVDEEGIQRYCAGLKSKHSV